MSTGSNHPAGEGTDFLCSLQAVIDQRKGADPGTSYVAKLHAKGLDAVLKKVAEEAGEFIMAAKDVAHTPSDANRQLLVNETADVWFHTLVALSQQGVGAAEVLQELARREGIGGLAEKAARRN